MRISINLATRPFVELRPLFARLRLTMIVLAVLAFALVFGLRAERARAKAATAQMDALKAETNNYTQELARNRARMGEPQNKSVLNRSQFLNQLFASKSFSWTAVMMDLERVLPGGVQVTAIEPAVSKEGDVLIRLRVTGDRDKTVQLVRNLERSQRFVAPRLAGESMMTADKAKALGAPGFAAQAAMNVNQPVGNGVEFETFSGYNPLPEAMPGPRAQSPGISKPALSSGPVVHHDRKPVKP